jgi:hypothetical protein
MRGRDAAAWGAGLLAVRGFHLESGDLDFGQEGREMAITTKTEVEKPGGAAFPKGVGQPAIRALASAGYTQLDQLAGVREKDLASLHGMGPKALRILNEALKAEGKSFL